SPRFPYTTLFRSHAFAEGSSAGAFSSSAQMTSCPADEPPPVPPRSEAPSAEPPSEAESEPPHAASMVAPAARPPRARKLFRRICTSSPLNRGAAATRWRRSLVQHNAGGPCVWKTAQELAGSASVTGDDARGP